MISKKLFLNELNKLNINENNIFYEKFIFAYDIYLNGDDFNAWTLVDELLEYLFCPNVKSPDFCIPSNFLNSPIGIILFTIKYSNNSINKIFTVVEAAVIVNKSKSTLLLEIRNNTLISSNLDSIILIYENDLITYMKLKGFSLDDAKNRISKFIDLKHKNLSLAEIKSEINQEK